MKFSDTGDQSLYINDVPSVTLRSLSTTLWDNIEYLHDVGAHRMIVMPQPAQCCTAHATVRLGIIRPRQRFVLTCEVNGHSEGPTHTPSVEDLTDIVHAILNDTVSVIVS